MRRRLFQLAIVLVVVLAAAAAAMQYVLLSGIPRRVLEDQLRAELGVPVEVGRVSMSWGGHTKVARLKVAPPLADEPLLTTGPIHVRHRSPPLALVSGNLAIAHVDIQKAMLDVHQGILGRWNLFEVMQRATSGPGDASTGPLAFPEITLDAERILVRDRAGRSVSAEDVTVRGRPGGRGELWTFQVHVPDRLRVEGRIMPGTSWSHELEVKGNNLEKWLEPWLAAEPPEPVSVSAQWEGRLEEERGLVGHLRLRRARVGALRAQGDAEVGVKGLEVSVRPNGLALTPGEQWPVDRVRLRKGTVRLEARRLVVEQLRVATDLATAQLDGQYSWVRSRGELKATWSGLAPDAPWVKNHEGELTAKIREPRPGWVAAEIEVTTRGSGAMGNWSGTARLTGTGRAWSSTDWEVRLPEATLKTPEGDLVLDGLHGQLAYRAPTVRLKQVSLAGKKTLEATGRFNLHKKTWRLEGRADPAPVESPLVGPVTLTVRAKGQPGRIDVGKVALSGRRWELTGEGTYAADRESTPVTAHARATVSAETKGSSADSNGDSSNQGAAGILSWSGRVVAEADVRGELAPLDLVMDAKLAGEELTVGDRSFKAQTIPARFNLGPKTLAFRVAKTDLLGGEVAVAGEYTREAHHIDANVTLQSVDLQKAASLLRRGNNLRGSFGADLDLAMPAWKPGKLTATGRWRAENLRGASLAADTAKGTVKVEAGRIRLPDVRATRGEGELNGSVTVDMQETLQIRAETTLDRWPYALETPAVSASVSGRLHATVVPASGKVEGAAEVNSPVRLDGKKIGSVSLATTFDRPTVTVDHVEADILGGRLTGSGTVRLDRWQASDGKVEWSGLRPSRLAFRVPQLEHMEGTYAGRVDLGPAQGKRAPEPFKVEATMEASDGRWRSVSLDEVRLTGYLGDDRFLLDRCQLRAAGGTANLWGSATKPNQTRQMHYRVDLKDISLDQLNRSLFADAAPVAGLIGGSLTVSGPPTEPQRYIGKGTLRLSEARLANAPVIDGLYDAMGLVLDQPKTGSGTAKLRLEGTNLYLLKLKYFNRGTDVRASGVVRDIWKGPKAPIDGYAVGAGRPLRQLDIPVVKDIEKALASIQTALTPIKISGVLGAPKTRPTPLRDVSSTLLRILAGSSSE